MHRTIIFTFVLVMVSNHIRDTFEDASFNGIVSALLASKNRIPNSVFPWDLFLCVMCMHNRIAASRGCSKCRGYCTFFEAHLKVYHSISQYLNLLNQNHGFLSQAWQIRNSRFRGFHPSCATGKCHLQFLVCDDESRSRIFLYHDLSKSIWSAIDHSVMVLAHQCRENQQSKQFQSWRLDHFFGLHRSMRMVLSPSDFWALCILCTLTCVLPIRHPQEES